MTVKIWLELIGEEALEKLILERAGMAVGVPSMSSWDRHQRNRRICALYSKSNDWEVVRRYYPELSVRQLQRIWADTDS